MSQPREPRFAFLTVVSSFALAEMSDKTALATVTLASDHDWIGVWIGSTVGMVLADGLANAGADRRSAQVIEAKNDARVSLLSTERALGQVGDKLEASERKHIESLVAELKRKFDTEDLEAIKAANKALNEGTVHLAELLMSTTLEKNVKNSKVGDIVRK